MKTIYSNQDGIRKMQRDIKKENLGRALSKAKPYIAGTLAGLVLLGAGIAVSKGMEFYFSKTIKPYVIEAESQIEKKAYDESRLNSFLEKEWRK